LLDPFLAGAAARCALNAQVSIDNPLSYRLYEAVGLGWVYGFTKYEPLRKAADAVYGVWAKYRLPITGREDFQTILRRRDERTCK
jgi:predicted DCC family thiol-disulfide oxidoreductase YuxK